jgi:hypothetical protein
MVPRKVREKLIFGRAELHGRFPVEALRGRVAGCVCVHYRTLIDARPHARRRHAPNRRFAVSSVSAVLLADGLTLPCIISPDSVGSCGLSAQLQRLACAKKFSGEKNYWVEGGDFRDQNRKNRKNRRLADYGFFNMTIW